MENNTTGANSMPLPPKDNRRSSLDTAIRLLRRNPLQSAAIVALLVLTGALESIGIMAITPLLENLQSAGEASEHSGQIARVLGFQPSSMAIAICVLAIFVIKAAVRFFALDWINHITKRISHEMRVRISSALAKARWSYFTEQSVGKFIDTYSSQTQAAGNAFMAACRLISEAAQGFAYIAATAFISWKVAVAAPILMGGTLYLFRGLMDRIKQSGSKRVRQTQTLAARTADGLNGFKPLKSMGQEHLLVHELDVMSERVAAEERRQASTVALLNTMQEPVLIALMIVAAGLAMTLTAMPLPTLMVLGLLGYRALGRVGTLQTAFASFIQAEVVYRALETTIEHIEQQREVLSGTETPTFERAMELRGVHFAYPGREVLVDCDLTIPSGSFVAIEGPSGSGKTTLVDLILGLNSPTTGEILIDGVPLSRIDISKWRRMVGYVTQDAALLHGSILENVTMRDPSVAREAAIAALNAAGLGQFVRELPEGIDASIGERGAKISGGQRQRIAIARALVRKPKLLILDEATSALDPESQLQIKATIESLARSLTVIAITHQHNFVDGADLRCTVVSGRIIVGKQSRLRSAAG